MTTTAFRSSALLAGLACALAASSQALAACPSSPGRFVASGAEVKDTQTGLIWQRCSAGQVWSGSTCTGTSSRFIYEQALAYGHANATAQGWRMPNRAELFSLVDKGCTKPTIDSVAYPSTPAHYYWSSSPIDGGNASYAWGVSFFGGTAVNYHRHAGNHVRLVRASP